MYHPYQSGYNVLPGLMPLGDEPVFEVDGRLAEYLAAKRAIAHQPHHERNVDPLAMSTVCKFMHDRLLKEHPSFRPTRDFVEIAMQVQEDLVIHQFAASAAAESHDWMAACHVSFPSHWRPEEKIGRSFVEIHAPVPGMKASPQLARSMLKGPFKRFVWGVEFAPRLNGHPDQPREPFSGRVWVKVERQVVYPFPEVHAALFTIRQHLVEPDLAALRAAVLGMTSIERVYKKMPEDFVAWLATQG